MNYLQFLKDNKYLLTFGFLCVFVGNLGQTFFISLFNKELIEQLLLDEKGLSLSYSAATLVSGFSMFFIGGKIDTVEVKKFTIIVLLALMASCLLFAHSQNLYSLFVAYLGIRLCGQGLMGHIAVTTLMKYIPQGRAKAVSLATQGMAFGEVILPLMAIYLLKTQGFTGSWHWYIAITLLLLFPLMMWLLHKAKLQPIERQEQKSQQISEQKEWTRNQVMADWRFWMLLPAIIGPAFLITGLLYHQTFWVEAKSWSMEWLGVSFIFYGVVHFSAAIFIGPLVDASHPRKYLRWYLLPLLLAVLCLWLGQDKYWLVAFMILAGISVAASGPVVNAFYAEVFGTAHLGAIRSFAFALMILSTGIAPYLFASFSNLDDFMIFALAYSVLAMLLVQKRTQAELISPSSK